MSDEDRIEGLIRRAQAGDRRASADLFPLVYDELRRLAGGCMARQPGAHTLQATALVGEVYLRMCGGGASWVDRDHFLRLASTVMRQVLVDHARRRGRDKRSAGGERIELDLLVEGYERSSGDLVALDAALERLAARDPQLAQLVELRFFGGQTMDEAARMLAISPRQAARWWLTARAFLQREIARA